METLLLSRLITLPPDTVMLSDFGESFYYMPVVLCFDCNVHLLISSHKSDRFGGFETIK